MSDRILDPWGDRAPHGGGAAWPVREDLYLRPGVAEHEVDRWVQSACVLCSNGCGLDIAVKDGRMVGVRGRAHDRVNHGRLGPKGLYGWQANHAADRLTRPLVRQDGELVPSDWDTAMACWSSAPRSCWPTRAAAPSASTTAASCSWRSTTPSGCW